MSIIKNRTAPVRRHRNPGNRERILEGTIELMNLQGGNAGTTQIAEHCGVSPGNLYYHFRNREDILQEIFSQLEVDLGDVLATQGNEEIIAERMAGFYNAGAQVLWRYRFLFSGATEFVFRDPKLAVQYRAFSLRSIGQIQQILENVTRQQPGIMPADSDSCRSLAENKWVLWIAWPRYAEILSGGGAVSEGDYARGLAQIFNLLTPYLEPGYCARTRRAIDEFVEDFHTGHYVPGSPRNTI